MPYRATIRIHVISRDATTGQEHVVRRKDMDFTVLINDPSEIVPAAKAEFAKTHGPDLVVRCCNVQTRNTGLLYTCPAVHAPQNVIPRDLPHTRALRRQR